MSSLWTCFGISAASFNALAWSRIEIYDLRMTEDAKPTLSYSWVGNETRSEGGGRWTTGLLFSTAWDGWENKTIVPFFAELPDITKNWLGQASVMARLPPRCHHGVYLSSHVYTSSSHLNRILNASLKSLSEKVLMSTLRFPVTCGDDLGSRPSRHVMIVFLLGSSIIFF